MIAKWVEAWRTWRNERDGRRRLVLWLVDSGAVR